MFHARLGCVLPAFLFVWTGAFAADIGSTSNSRSDEKFRQFLSEWPTPNDYRTAAGAPGPRYWQQKVDYRIRARLDEETKTISGEEEVTYSNRSPDTLHYLWLLLDQNIERPDSIAHLSAAVTDSSAISLKEVRRALRLQSWLGGFSGLVVTDLAGRPLAHTVVDTLMRIDLPNGLAAGSQVRFRVGWSVALPEAKVVGIRGGYECPPEKTPAGGCTFQAGQWFPRLAAYSDFQGWHIKPFLGTGEFPLEFGDYDVELTVPAGHLVAATGELQNGSEVLSRVQRERLQRAAHSDTPIRIVTPDEAAAASRAPIRGTRTWRFHGTQVRDFAFASSSGFLWDAMRVKQADSQTPQVMCMAFYPASARPIADAWSVKAVAHTIRTYARFTFPYPYPVAQVVNGPVEGMEYPMIAFSGHRPMPGADGTLSYSQMNKLGVIAGPIHEVGHNWFPMIINSDERQWMWLDEGLNSFLEFEAEKLWAPDFPSFYGEHPRDIASYMTGGGQIPIMTQSDSLGFYGPNAYSKPAAALVFLRETILGRDLFDYAFKEYARRWKFKRPTPYDFFRTLEDASGVDLDWFWRGWFYTTDHLDISLDRISRGRLDTLDPDIEKPRLREAQRNLPPLLTVQRNKDVPVEESDPAVRDYYDTADEFAVTRQDRDRYAAALERLNPQERAALQTHSYFYTFSFRNVGGLVAPIILKLDYADGGSETVRIPVEVWRTNPERVSWRYVTPRTLVAAEIDPLWETPDSDRHNNSYRGAIADETLEVRLPPPDENRMRDAGLRVRPDSLRTEPAQPSR